MNAPVPEPHLGVGKGVLGQHVKARAQKHDLGGRDGELTLVPALWVGDGGETDHTDDVT